MPPLDERAAIMAAWTAYMESIDAEYEQYERSIHQDGFWAAWQARGEYETRRATETMLLLNRLSQYWHARYHERNPDRPRYTVSTCPDALCVEAWRALADPAPMPEEEQRS